MAPRQKLRKLESLLWDPEAVLLPTIDEDAKPCPPATTQRHDMATSSVSTVASSSDAQAPSFRPKKAQGPSMETTSAPGGSDDVDFDEEASWAEFACMPSRGKKWPEWSCRVGICNMLHTQDPRRGHAPLREGKSLRVAFDLCCKLIEDGGLPLPAHKIGIAYSVFDRWVRYNDDDSRWTPCIMFIICRCSSRSAAAYVEAALIIMLQSLHEQSSLNLLHGDMGGEGRISPDTKFLPHYVYLALKRM